MNIKINVLGNLSFMSYRNEGKKKRKEENQQKKNIKKTTGEKQHTFVAIDERISHKTGWAFTHCSMIICLAFGRWSARSRHGTRVYTKKINADFRF